MEKRNKQTISRIILNSVWLKKIMENRLSSSGCGVIKLFFFQAALVNALCPQRRDRFFFFFFGVA